MLWIPQAYGKILVLQPNQTPKIMNSGDPENHFNKERIPQATHQVLYIHRTILGKKLSLESRLFMGFYFSFQLPRFCSNLLLLKCSKHSSGIWKKPKPWPNQRCKIPEQQQARNLKDLYWPQPATSINFFRCRKFQLLQDEEGLSNGGTSKAFYDPLLLMGL